MNEVKESQSRSKNDFAQRLEMLALTLSLKEDSKNFVSSGGYELLFETYIKMIENDLDQFFIDKDRKPKLLESLQRTTELKNLDDAKKLQSIFEKLANNDPTDFIFVPSFFYLGAYGKGQPHMCGLIVYKKENDFMVVRVDKEERFGEGQVSHVKVPSKNVEMLSNLLWIEPKMLQWEVVDLFKDIEAISDKFQPLPTVQMEKGTIEKGVVNEVEDSLKVVLSYCQIDFFSIEKKDKVIPTWHFSSANPTLDMRKRFLETIKGVNVAQNEQLDYLFDYCLYQMGESAKNVLLSENRQSDWWYRSIQNVFARDPYIIELMNEHGALPSLNEERLKQRIEWAIQPLNRLYEQALSQVPGKELMDTLYLDGILLTMNEDRLSAITIPLAKEMNQRLLVRLEERYEKINDEIRRRDKLRREQLSQANLEKQLVHSEANSVSERIAYFFQPERKRKKQTIDFAKQVDMLTMTLSLKGNDNDFFIPENYQVLFSIYIKMIENDPDSFFIDKKRRPQIIHSLKRTIELNQLEQQEALYRILSDLRNNDPTDFLLFPACFYMLDPKDFGHICGLTIFKRDNRFVVMQVDKEQFYKVGAVSYVEIPLNKMEELSHIVFSSKDFSRMRPYYLLRAIEALSHKFKAIPEIQLALQTTGNCGISEIEASLRIILFHCVTDIFALDRPDKITPKWQGAGDKKDDLGMRKRFLAALKGQNQDWNKNLDYIFTYYRYRKLNVQSSFDSEEAKQTWYGHVRELFREDPYIIEMLSREGRIPQKFDQDLKAKISGDIGAKGIVHKEKICEIETSKLTSLLHDNVRQIQMLKEKFDYCKIPVAKKMTKYFISCIEEKNKEIRGELFQRNIIEKTAREKACNSQEIDHLKSPSANQLASMIDRVKKASQIESQRSGSERITRKVKNNLEK